MNSLVIECLRKKVEAFDITDFIENSVKATKQLFFEFGFFMFSVLEMNSSWIILLSMKNKEGN